ncbi:hypothetical protein AAKU52_000350 [Pedobacter sp. CG_S7]|uniref:DUF6580 family putative transport protein n=1 Tax=Pedobacter sp. CG_S7 TaxID=3143930 RepID=UPI0033977353
MSTIEKINLRTSILILFILLAAFSRTLPHLPNFSPLAAIGLFGAAYFNKKWQIFLIPIAATWLSDLFINNYIYKEYYPSFTWFYTGFYWQYGSYLLIIVAGILFLKKINTSRVIGSSLLAATLFFLITNFGVWIGSTAYPQNFSGLLACYAAGIPFLKGTLLGNLFYAGVLFFGFSLMQQKYNFLKLAKAYDLKRQN